jgi:chromosome segregation ATPase
VKEMFKKLKSLFVIEEGDKAPESKTASDEKNPPSSRDNKMVHHTPSVNPVPNVDGKVQDKFLEVLFEALQKNNQEGFDYLEFKDFLRSLANVQMDDSTRFKSAFATAQTMGATKENILKSARQYISILSDEQVKFQEALTGQKEKNLTGKQEEIKKLEKTIQQNQADIEKLTAEIGEHRKQIETLEADINSASDKLAQTESDFGATYQALLSQIQDDVKNIESHL